MHIEGHALARQRMVKVKQQPIGPELAHQTGIRGHAIGRRELNHIAHLIIALARSFRVCKLCPDCADQTPRPAAS
jgi:hypothetical protein